MKQWFSDLGQQEHRTLTPNRLEIKEANAMTPRRGNPGGAPRSPRVEERS